MNAARGSSIEDLDALYADGRLSFRTYVVASNLYKAQLATRGWPAEAHSLVRLARMPRYVVVVEAIDRAKRATGEPCVLGEAAFDATSADVQPDLLAARLHGVVVTYADGAVAGGPAITDPILVLSGASGAP